MEEVIAITGSPNCGKTALFNALTGTRQKVANFPGVTVEKKEGTIISDSGRSFRIVDLPGTYSLDPKSPDEKVAFDLLTNSNESVIPSALIAVADATNLERSLSLALELKKLGKPVILALNMMDLAKQRGLCLDLKILERELGFSVVPTVAVKNRGVKSLVENVESMLSKKELTPVTPIHFEKAKGSEIRERFNEIDRILKLATREEVAPSIWTKRLDKIVLHPIGGHIVLATLLFFVFQGVYSWATPFMDVIDGAVGSFGEFVSTLLPEGAINSLVVDGIIAGVGSVIIFLPQILLLFLFILLLEDSGYLARAAFLMDRSMKKVGLHGRAFIPLLSSYACAIPGIMATRTIPDVKDRIATITIAPLMTCSARLPVYTLIIAAFIPPTTVAGVFNLQGVVMFGLYFVTIPLALIIAFTFKKTLLKGQVPPFILELPTYKIPSWRNVLFGLKERARVFLRRAGKLIFATSILLWVLATYPKPPENAELPAINYSYAGQLGHAIEPLIAPAGFDWRIGTGLIPGFAAREVMVGALGTVFAIEAASDEEQEEKLATRLASVWSLPTALALLVWYIFSPQCLATFAVIRRETNSWGWTSLIFFYLLGLAYVGAVITYQVATYF